MEPSKVRVQRLRISGQFRQVREKGASVTGRWLVLGILKDPAGSDEKAPEFGVITSRKVGSAVTRNLVRRRLRHIHLAHCAQVRGGLWCVTVARFRAAKATFQQLDAEWFQLAKRAGILLPCES